MDCIPSVPQRFTYGWSGMYIDRTFALGAIWLLFSLSCVSAEEQVLTLGGKDGWSHIETMEGLAVAPGRYGYDSLTLATNSHPLEQTTDLLVDFEGGVPVDRAGHYDVSENNTIASSVAKMGRTAGMTRGVGGLRLTGRPNSLFGTSGDAGSFTLEFYLNPSIAETGEIVFSWRSSRTEDDYPLYQMISASFYNNRLR